MMAKQARTKDEIFMIRLYEESLKHSEIDQPLDKYYIGNLANMQRRGVDATCHLLIQTNFIKKCSQTEISITPHGIKLAKSLLEKP